VRILSGQRSGQLHPAGPDGQVPLALVTDGGDVPGQVRLDDGRQHGRPVLVALAATDDDLVGAEVNVLDAKMTALEHPQTRPVQQAGHEPGRTGESLDNRAPRRG
jgi:hypothetical protein